MQIARLSEPAKAAARKHKLTNANLNPAPMARQTGLPKINAQESCTFHQEMPKLTPGALRPEFEWSIFDMLLTQAEIARHLDVSPETIRLWRKAGTFPAPEPDAPGKRPRWSLESVTAFWCEHNAWRDEAPEPEPDTVGMSPLAGLAFVERAIPHDLYAHALALAELLADDAPSGGQGGTLENAWLFQTLASERDRLHQESVVSISRPVRGAPDHAAKLAKAQRRAAIERQYSDQELTLLRAVLVDEESFDKAGERIGMTAEAAKATVVDCVKRLAERT